MRRKDEEITNINEIVSILKKCCVCRLAFADENMPYIIPMNFGFEFEYEKICFYFHCANEGKKLDIIKNNQNTSFETDCSHKLMEGNSACSYTMNFESVISSGKIYIVEDETEKEKALNSIMRQCTGKDKFDFGNRLKNVTILRLDAEEITAKRKAK